MTTRAGKGVEVFPLVSSFFFLFCVGLVPRSRPHVQLLKFCLFLGGISVVCAASGTKWCALSRMVKFTEDRVAARHYLSDMVTSRDVEADTRYQFHATFR